MEFSYLQYRFLLGGGRELAFRLRLDADTFEAIEASPSSPAEWTRLGFHQCPNCPLSADKQPYCPAASGLARVLDQFVSVDAYAQAQVEVTTPERSISARVPVQRGLSSLAGFVMATSGCPRTAFLRPMARFHLPFATDDETLYRAASMYLLAQYYVAKQGGQPDLDMEGLAERYRELRTVNSAMTARLKNAFGSAPAAQAITSLDLFSYQLPFDVRSDLARVRGLFEPYFRP